MSQPTAKLIDQPRFLALSGIILAAALFRLVDHGLVNVAPVGAMALFAGACFTSRRLAVAVPLLAMLLSDVLLYTSRYNDFSTNGWKILPFVYLAFVVVTGLGFLLRNRRRSVWSVTGFSLAGSLVFFVLSNLSFWMFYGMYPLTPAGLIDCYVNAIPFFRGQSPLLNTILGDLTFNAALFGSFAFAESRLPALKPVPVEA